MQLLNLFAEQEPVSMYKMLLHLPSREEKDVNLARKNSPTARWQRTARRRLCMKHSVLCLPKSRGQISWLQVHFNT